MSRRARPAHTARRATPPLRAGRAAAILAMVVAAILWAAAEVASAAGSLTVWGGSLPDGTHVPAGPWIGVNDGSIAGGPFGVRMAPGARLGWSQTAALTVPSGLTFSSVSAERSFDTPTSADTAQPQIVSTWEGRGWPYNGISSYGGYVAASGSGTVTASNAPSLSVSVSCVTFGTGGGSCTGGAYWSATRMTYVLGDSTPPTGALTAGGGSLLDGSWHTSSTSELTLSGGDGESGLYRAFVREGATTHYASLVPADPTCQDARPGIGSDYEFRATVTTLAPCPRATDAYNPGIDLVAIGDGTHTIDIGVEDASGREKILATGRTLKVNAPGGTLGDPGTIEPSGCVHVADGSCVAPPVNTVAPAISSAPRRGSTLVADTGQWANVLGATWSYEWQRCTSASDASTCMAIAIAGSATYTPILYDVDRYLRVGVTATSSSFPLVRPVTAYSPITARVAAGDGSTAPPSGAGGAGGITLIAPAGGIQIAPANESGSIRPTPTAATTAEPGRCNGQTCANQARIAAVFDQSATDALRITYGTRVSISGRLTDADANPISGAELTVDPIARAGARSDPSRVITDHDGAFAIAIPAGAVSQIVRIAYRAHDTDTTGAAVATLALKVRAAATLTVSIARRMVGVARNGDAVTFTGHVSGTIPVGGKTVFLQANSGHGWAQFGPSKTLKADRHGAFSYRYVLGKTWGRVTYRFRVYVPAVDGGPTAQFPFADGYSKVISLHVFGYPLTKRPG